MKRIYGIEHIPCDTQMRTVLDDVEPEEIKPLFKDIFRQAQRGKGAYTKLGGGEDAEYQKYGIISGVQARY